MGVTIPKEQLETTVVFGDVHGIYYDKKAWQILLQVIEDIKPDRVVINGDFMDCYSISHFDKDPNRNYNIQDEFDQANGLLDELQHIHNGETIFVCGNHCDRLRKKLWKDAPELSSLSGMTIQSRLFLEERKIKWIEPKGKSAYYQMGKIKIGHFNLARQDSCATEKALVLRYAGTVLQGHCFSEDTEVLSWSGWKTFDKLSVGEQVMTMNLSNNQSEWNDVKDVFHYDDYDEMIHFDNKVVDLLVTPEHSIVRSKRVNGSMNDTYSEFERVEAKDFYGVRNDMPCGGVNNQPDYPISDDLLKLLAWCITEGNYPKDSDGIRIAQSEKEKVGVKHITDLIDNLGTTYSVKKRYDADTTVHGQHRNYDAYRIHLHSSDVSKKIKSLSPNKQLQKWMFDLSYRQFKMMFHELILADGCYNKMSTRSSQYASKYENEIDILQSLCSINGYRSSKLKRTRNGAVYYILTINTRGVSSVEHGELVSYKGKVWCASVDNQTLMVRRNGKTVISGNTHKLGKFYKSFDGDVVVGVGTGCLCGLDPEYCSDPDWCQGFVVINKLKGVNRFHIQDVPIIKHETLFNGKLYSV